MDNAVDIVEPSKERSDYWEPRIIRSGDDEEGFDFSIREVYCDKDGVPTG